MACSNSRYGVRFIIDFLLLLLVLVTIFMVKKLWPSFYRGMLCNDHSLTYPYIDDETITDSILLMYGVAVPVNMSSQQIEFTFPICMIATLGIGDLLLFLLAEPYERGFFCYEKSIRYPYKDSTVTYTVLLLVGTFVPILVMCLLEFLRARKETIGKELRYFGRRFGSWLWAMYSSVGVFLFGCAVTQLFTDIGKVTLGLLRPHFIDVCKPDWSKTNCSVNSLAYVFPIPCTTHDEDRLKDARQSFPSGHASFSTYTMIYLVIYLQARLQIPDFKLVKPLLQLICLLLNFFTCLSRISDYKHHWYDVVGGFLLGLTVAVLVAVYVSNLFVKKTTTKSKNTVVMLQDYHQTTAEEPHNNSHP